MRFFKKAIESVRSCAVAVLLILIIVICCFPPKNDNPASLREQDSISVDSRPSSTEGLAIDLNDARCLRIGVVEEEDAQYTTILPAQQGSRFKSEIHYLNICDVCINVDGEVARLDEALRNGLISLDEIFAYAQIDARNGFCQNYAKTRNGLNFLVYRYPEYDLRLTYDFTYTPDGKTHLVHELYVCRNDYELSGSAATTVHEDWGLTFEVVEASADSITLNCTQSGGQQLGELIADFYYIDLAEGDSALPRLDDAYDTDAYQPKPVLQRDTSTQIILNWTNIYGALPSGDYVMTLKVSDLYDAGENQTLMSKFESRQSYFIDFSIP